MRSLLKAVAASLLLLLACHGSARTALNSTARGRAPSWELLVFELPDCTYCRIFRRDVLPYYRQAVPGDAVPLRFVDLMTTPTGDYSLNGRIDAVPTAVLMKNGDEVGRIVGYWGRDAFFRLLSHMLARME
jgi:thioredoxin-related protein